MNLPKISFSNPFRKKGLPKDLSFINKLGKKYDHKIKYEDFFDGLTAERSLAEGERFLEMADAAPASMKLALIEKACNHFKHSLALSPDMDAAHKNLGRALFEKMLVESKLAGVREEALPFMLSVPKGRKNAAGVLLVHDFGATPEQMRHLGEYLNEMGFAVLAARLPGHGRSHQSLEHSKPNEWFDEIEKGFYTINEVASKVFVLGQGFGASLALLLAAHNAEVAGVVSLSAPAVMQAKWFVFAPFLNTLVKYRAQKLYHEHPEAYHRFIPLGSVKRLKALVNEYPNHLRRVICPVLLLYSHNDDFSHPNNSPKLIMSKCNSQICRVVYVGNKYVLTEKNDDQQRADNIISSFIQEIAATGR